MATMQAYQLDTTLQHITHFFLLLFFPDFWSDLKLLMLFLPPLVLCNSANFSFFSSCNWGSFFFSLLFFFLNFNINFQSCLNVCFGTKAKFLHQKPTYFARSIECTLYFLPQTECFWRASRKGSMTAISLLAF